MSGYDGFSMSNNARDAYSEGAVPLSKITAWWVKLHKIPCTVTQLKALIALDEVGTGEWHHTGMHFNETGFYRPDEVREQVEALSRETIDAAVETVRKKKDEGEVHLDCHVEWLEWFGRGVRPDEHTASGATVRVKGQTAYVEFADGSTMTKRLSATGFYFESAVDRKARLDYRKRLEAQQKKAQQERTRRVKAVLKNKKFEQCDYFSWRDDHDRDSSAVTWTPITPAWLITSIEASGSSYGDRTIERLESGDREVVRVGLRVGIRLRQVHTASKEAAA